MLPTSTRLMDRLRRGVERLQESEARETGLKVSSGHGRTVVPRNSAAVPTQDPHKNKPVNIPAWSSVDSGDFTPTGELWKVDGF